MKTVLITGATDGLGKAVAFELASQDHELLLHGRNPQRGKPLLEEISAATGNERLAYNNADFAEMAPQQKDKGVTVNVLHPATYLPTKIGPNPVSKMEDGVESVCMLAIAEEMADMTGKYFFQTREQRASAQAYDATERKKLMELSFKLTGV